MKSLFNGMLLVATVAGLIFSAGCGTKAKEKGNKEAAASVADAKPTDASSWEYSESVDNMSSKKNYYAKLKSPTKVNFDFPYDGGSTFKLIIVTTEDKFSLVELSVSKGQFMTSIGDEETMRIKFDDEAPMNVNYSSASDGSSDRIYIKSTDEIITKLKTSKKLIVEPSFYQAGARQIEFNTEGFKWDH